MTTTTAVTSNAANYLTGDLVANWDASIADTFGEYAAAYDIPAIRDAYLDQIAEILPDGWTITGDFIWAEVGTQDITEDERQGLREKVAAIDFWAIAEAHTVNVDAEQNA